MQCPFCRTENREDRDHCYHCEKDLTMLRLIVHKARSHFNTALEYADRNRDEEAVGELVNALELDYSHIPSHVVLGTLYARLGDTEKAEEHWREALKLNPQLDKAHQYLGKVDVVRRDLPLVRRQRLWVAMLLGLVVVLGVGLYILNRPNPNRKRMEQAWRLYQTGRFREAAQLAEQADEVETPDLYVANTLLIGDIARESQEMAVFRASRELREGRLREAVRLARGFLRADPSPDVRRRMEEILADAARQARIAVDETVEHYSAGATPRLRAQEALETYTMAAGDAADPEFIQAARERMNRAEREREIAIGLAAVRVAPPEEALLRLAALRERYPDAPRPAREYEALAKALNRRAGEIVEAHLERGDLDGAAKAIEQARAVMEATHAGEDTAARIAAWGEKIARLRSERDEERQTQTVQALEAAFKKAYRDEDYEKAVEYGEKLVATVDDETMRGVFNVTLQRAHRALADERWRWMVDRGRQYVDGRVDKDAARRTVDWYPQVREHLSRKMYPTSRDNLLFYYAMALRELGRRDEYAQAMRRLFRDFPEGNALQWARPFAQRDNLDIP